MDVIEDFSSRNSTQKRTKVSDFFLQREEIIVKIQYDTIDDLNALNLKKFWVEQFAQHKEKFVFDFNVVNWPRLLRLIVNNMIQDQTIATAGSLLISNLKGRSKNIKFDQVDEIDAFFLKPNDPDIPFNLDIPSLNKDLLMMINEAKKERVEVHQRDYMYYGILDFVTKVEENATRRLLKDDFLKWNNAIKERCIDALNSNTSSAQFTPNIAYDYTKSLVRSMADTEQRPRAKVVLEATDRGYRWKKKCLKIIKLQQKRARGSIVSQNEYTFLISYFSGIFMTLFDLNEKEWYYKWGETKLSASKEEENLAKNDDENRSSGSSIDGIICLKRLNLDLLILEISGPMWKEDFTHYLKDRQKIAKNLKKMMKSILRQKLVMAEAKDLMLFGMQLYKNTIHLYCLTMPIIGFYCFVEVMSYPIPTNPATYPKDLPRYVKNLFKTLKLVIHGADVLQRYMTSFEYYSSDETISDDNSPLSPPFISPQKTGKRKGISKTSTTDSNIDNKRKQTSSML